MAKRGFNEVTHEFLEDVMENPPQCFSCKHNWDGKYGCDAFPDGKPDDILAGIADHSQPFRGDGGMLYFPIGDNEGVEKILSGKSLSDAEAGWKITKADIEAAEEEFGAKVEEWAS